jgi:hypothetical protein
MDMVNEVARLRSTTGLPLDIRIGLHIGSAIGGVIGRTRPRYFIFGPDPMRANALESLSLAGGILVSEVAALQLVQEGFSLVP